MEGWPSFQTRSWLGYCAQAKSLIQAGRRRKTRIGPRKFGSKSRELFTEFQMHLPKSCIKKANELRQANGWLCSEFLKQLIMKFLKEVLHLSQNRLARFIEIYGNVWALSAF